MIKINTLRLTKLFSLVTLTFVKLLGFHIHSLRLAKLPLDANVVPPSQGGP